MPSLRSSRVRAAAALAVSLLFAKPLFAQYQAPSSKLLIASASAETWTQDKSSVIELHGPVKLQLDDTTLTADGAVIWLSPVPGSAFEDQQAEIAMLGNASLAQPREGITRSGTKLFVSATVRGAIRVTADQRLARDMSDSPLYAQAAALRAAGGAGQADAGQQPTQRELPTTQGVEPGAPTDVAPEVAAPPAGTALGGGPSRRGGGGASAAGANPEAAGDRGVVTFHADLVEQAPTPDDTVAQALSGHVTLLQTRPNGDVLELLADRVVLFTDLKNDQLKSPGDLARVGQHVRAAYLEGDVRINYTPAQAPKPEQRLTARRAYYEFATDRAVLTDAILHTTEPRTQIPVVVRANKIRQLAQGEYNAEHVEMTNSEFATPSFSVRASKIYIRQLPPNKYGQTDTDFVASDDTLRFFGVPLFYLPKISGTLNDDEFPLRQANVENSKRFGFGIETRWGLFESLGVPRPKDLDVSFTLDYLGKRGPGGGFDGKYAGVYGDDPEKGPTSFAGDFKSYVIFDHGNDVFGGDRQDVIDPNNGNPRGRVLWEHQHFFPDGWQVQARAGYVSDPTFLDEYFEREFDQDLPYDASFYVKRQHDTEAITFLGEVNTSRSVTTADRLQENFDVERLPEIGYRRIGDSLGDDRFTFFSDNSASRLRFARSSATPADYGAVAGFTDPIAGSPFSNSLPFGVPSAGYTGRKSGPVYRADSRQEIDYPINAGKFKIVPYVVGRYTGYTDSPDGDAKNRLMAGAGVRITTSFWKIDESAESDLFDVHRVRHVIEPELNLFTSSSSVDRDNVYVYDQSVDGINDISVADFTLHNTWQTKRGGPGRWRNVDFLTLDLSADVYTNPPNDLNVSDDKRVSPDPQFRGVFFPSAPETSIPRDSLSELLTWRVTDSTAVLSDAVYNVDKAKLATAAAGLAVSRDERMSYFVGVRYIEPLDSDIVSAIVNYQLTQKYSLELAQSYDLGASRNETTSVTIVRAFDTFSTSLSVFTDAYNGESGFRFNVFPNALGGTAGQTLGNLFNPQ